MSSEARHAGASIRG